LFKDKAEKAPIALFSGDCKIGRAAARQSNNTKSQAIVRREFYPGERRIARRIILLNYCKQRVKYLPVVDL
jgi:hypothetical protein